MFGHSYSRAGVAFRCDPKPHVIFQGRKGIHSFYSLKTKSSLIPRNHDPEISVRQQNKSGEHEYFFPPILSKDAPFYLLASCVETRYHEVCFQLNPGVPSSDEEMRMGVFYSSSGKKISLVRGISRRIKTGLFGNWIVPSEEKEVCGEHEST